MTTLKRLWQDGNQILGMDLKRWLSKVPPFGFASLCKCWEEEERSRDSSSKSPGLPGISGKVSPCPGIAKQRHPTCASYSTGMLACLLQHVRIAQPIMFCILSEWQSAHKPWFVWELMDEDLKLLLDDGLQTTVWVHCLVWLNSQISDKFQLRPLFHPKKAVAHEIADRNEIWTDRKELHSVACLLMKFKSECDFLTIDSINGGNTLGLYLNCLLDSEFKNKLIRMCI